MDCDEGCCLCAEAAAAKGDTLIAVRYCQLYFIDAEISLRAYQHSDIASRTACLLKRKRVVILSAVGDKALCGIGMRTAGKLLERHLRVEGRQAEMKRLFHCRHHQALYAVAPDGCPFRVCALQAAYFGYPYFHRLFHQPFKAVLILWWGDRKMQAERERILAIAQIE